MVGTRLIQARLGHELVWVEAVVLPGSEKTSATGETAEKVLDAFEAAQSAILDLAEKVARTSVDLGKRAVSPNEICVEFGLKIATTGTIVFASGTAEASLVVKLTYNHQKNPEAATPTHRGA